jgi:hypothetical protein
MESQCALIQPSETTRGDVQAALIAGFSFSGLFVNDNAESAAVNYLFFFFAVLSLMTALYTVCHATFVSVWAPSLALRGDSPEGELCGWHRAFVSASSL